MEPIIVVQGSCQDNKILGEAMFALEEEIYSIFEKESILREIARSITGENDVNIVASKKEFKTSSGSIDIFAIDNKGRIYLF